MEGGHSALFGVPSSVNRRLWAISDSERYLRERIQFEFFGITGSQSQQYEGSPACMERC